MFCTEEGRARHRAMQGDTATLGGGRRQGAELQECTLGALSAWSAGPALLSPTCTCLPGVRGREGLAHMQRNRCGAGRDWRRAQNVSGAGSPGLGQVGRSHSFGSGGGWAYEGQEERVRKHPRISGDLVLLPIPSPSSPGPLGWFTETLWATCTVSPHRGPAPGPPHPATAPLGGVRQGSCFGSQV